MLVVAALLWVIGEYFAPPADQYARQYKIFSRYSQLEFTGSRSSWVREGPYFINVRRQAAENLFGGVFVYELDEDRRLRMVGRAETATQDAKRALGAHELRRDPAPGRPRQGTHRVAKLVTDPKFSAEFLGVAVTEPGSLPLADLYAYKEHLEANQLDSAVWDIAFWSRISRLVAAVASACSPSPSPSGRSGPPARARAPCSASWPACCSSC